MATRYWVGGSGNWSDAANHWATTTGGAGNAANLPTSADNVIFDQNSNVGTGAFTVTVDGTEASPSNCADFSTSSLDGAMTLAFGSTGFIYCYGSMTFPATNFSITNSGSFTSGIVFVATTTGKTFTTNGVTVGTNMSIVFSGVGGGWTLGSALTTTNAGIEIRAGSFSTGNYNITSNSLSSTATYAANTRAITLGSSTISLTGAASPLNLYGGGTLTFSAGTSTINFSNASPTFSGGGHTFYNVGFTSTAISAVTITGANTYNNLSFTARAAAGIGQVIITGGITQTVNGTLTLGSGTTGVARLVVRSGVIGSPATLSVATLAAITDIDFRDITAAGASAASNWSGTRIGDCGGNTKITGATPRTVYWVSAASANWNGAVWNTTSGNTGGATTNFPLAQDSIVIDNAGLTTGNTITINAAYQIPSISFATRSNAANFATGATTLNLYGDYILSSAITPSGASTFFFSKQSGIQTITSAGITFTQPINGTAPNGTLRINGNLTLDSTLTATLTYGTLDLTNNGAGNYTLSTGLFASNNSNTRAITFGTGNITLTGNNATILNMSPPTNFTYTGTPTVNCTYAGSTGTRTISSGATTETNALNFNISAGSDIVNINNTKNLNFTGFSGSLSTTAGRTIYGNLIISSGMTVTASTFTNTFAATSGTQQITTNGQTLDFPITVNAPGATVQLQDNLTLGSTRTFTLTAGTLDLSSGNRTLSTGLFSSSNSNTRSILFGTGNITITGTGGGVITMNTVTGFSYTGTPVFNCTYSGSGSRTIRFGSTAGATESNVPTVNITAGTDTFNISTSQFKNLNFTGFAGTLDAALNNTIYGNLIFSSGMTLPSVSNAITFAATSGTQQITTNGKTLDFNITQNSPGATLQLQDNLTIGSTRMFTLTAGTLDLNSNKVLSCGVFSSSNTNTRGISFGTGNITLTGSAGTVWSGGLTTNFTITGTPTINCTYSGSTGTRTISSGLTSPALNFNISAGSDTFAVGTTSGSFGKLDFTGFSGNMTNTTRFLYGNLILSATMTCDSGTLVTTFAGTSGTQAITSNGVTLDFPITIDGVGGTTQLSDALTMGSTRALTLTNGTFNSNNYNVTCGSFSSSNSNTRVLTMGSSQWTLNSSGWDTSTSTGLTVNAGTSVINMNSSTQQDFAGGGKTYYILKYTTAGNSTISGNNTFHDLQNSVQPLALTFTAGSTNNFTGFSLQGTAGNLVTLRSSTAGTQYTLNYL